MPRTRIDGYRICGKGMRCPIRCGLELYGKAAYSDKDFVAMRQLFRMCHDMGEESLRAKEVQQKQRKKFKKRSE